MKNHLYKPSYYNFFFTVNNEEWLFNSLNLGLVQIDESLKQILSQEYIDLDNYVSEDSTYLFGLLEGEFIIPSYVDESKLLQYMYHLDKYNREYLTITILPTLSCNCACYYCFERENSIKTHTTFSQQSQNFENCLISYIESKLPSIKHLSIAWFGGEPLLKFDKVEELSQRIIQLCKQYNVKYSSSITTNGYYLSIIPNIISRLKKCQIGTYQITLDGAPQDHNKIRKLKNDSSGTFDQILAGIKLLYKNRLNVSVRININKENINNIEVLFNVLEENNLKHLKIYFGQLIDYSGKDNWNLYFNTSEYAREIERLYTLLRSREFKYGLDDHYPSLARACVANRIDTAVIDNYGNIYKCRSQIGEFEKRIGSIYTDKKQTTEEAMREINWLEWTPFKYTHCKKCKYLPLCMGGCPYSLYDNEEGTPICDTWKYNLDFFVRQKINDSEVSKNEN